MTTINLNCAKCEQKFAVPLTAEAHLATVDYAGHPLKRLIEEAFAAGLRAASIRDGFLCCPTCEAEERARRG